MDDNRQSQLFLCNGWFNATCFVLTLSRHQENKTRQFYCVSYIILFHILYARLESPLQKISSNYTTSRNQ